MKLATIRRWKRDALEAYYDAQERRFSQPEDKEIAKHARRLASIIAEIERNRRWEPSVEQEISEVHFK